MSEKVAISVKNVYKSFKLPHEKPSGLKQAVIKFRPGKKYEVQHVLDDISFDIKEGEFFGIVGEQMAPAFADPSPECVVDIDRHAGRQPCQLIWCRASACRRATG